MSTEEESYIAISSVLISMNFLKYKDENENQLIKLKNLLADQEF